MKNLSKNLTYAEAIASQTATRHNIKNEPTKEVLERMVLVAEHIFQPIREHFNKPIRVSSFYRGSEVNKKVGGSKNSQHMTGEAIDLQGTNGVTNAEIFNFVRKNLNYDQLIWEYGTASEPAWVHISFKKSGNRKQVLVIGVDKRL